MLYFPFDGTYHEEVACTQRSSPWLAILIDEEVAKHEGQYK